MKVTLFIPCFIDLFYPQVGVAMVRILEKLGHSVVCPEGPACCGQPAFNTGYWDESREVAIKVLESLHGADLSVAQWVMDHDEMAGQGTNTLPGADAKR